ncbi:MAG: AraC family transcriptional regulator [Spirochaetota bacterium]
MEIPRLTVPFDEFPLRIVEKRHAAESTPPAHVHDCKELLYIVEGSGAIAIGENEFPIIRADCIVLRENETHRIIDSPERPIHLYAIYYADTLWTKSEQDAFFPLFDALSPADRVISTSASPFLARTGSLIKDMLFEQANTSGDRPLIAKAYLSELIVGILRHVRAAGDGAGSSGMSPTERKVQTLAEFLSRYCHRRNSIEAMAALVPLGKRQFSRIFYKVTGKNFKEYLNHARIEKAKVTLSTGADIVAACFEAGFEDVSYFYKVFKKETGLTPREYILSAGVRAVKR